MGTISDQNWKYILFSRSVQVLSVEKAIEYRTLRNCALANE